MVNRMMENIRIVLFGAGKRGKSSLSRLRDFGIEPEKFVDNNKALWGHKCEGIMVCNPELLVSFDFDYIFITCNKEQEIYRQLQELCIAEDKIIIMNHGVQNRLLYYVIQSLKLLKYEAKSEYRVDKRKVLFDLQNGQTLGGVELWSYDLAKKLKSQGYQGMYLTTNSVDPIAKDDTFPTYIFPYKEMNEGENKIEACVREIVKNLPCTIICNFPQYNFWSSCIVKKLYPDQIRIIAVQHSDDPAYYEAYDIWQEYVDQYMVISSRMETKLLSYGINQDRIRRIEWQVSCRENLERTWSKRGTCLQIGYAGRVTTVSKRVDLLLTVVRKLREKNIDFRLNIAGTGNYMETMQQKILEEELQEYIVLIGYLDRKDIPDFWSRQDIMVSCSEREGHSISQSEAMAQGAVPVITDVSGARDDVTDGYNGYVVDVGDMDAIVERISHLYHNRRELERMGRRAHGTIYERQKNMDQAKFWDDQIKKVWQG